MSIELKKIANMLVPTSMGTRNIHYNGQPVHASDKFTCHKMIKVIK